MEEQYTGYVFFKIVDLFFSLLLFKFDNVDKIWFHTVVLLYPRRIL